MTDVFLVELHRARILLVVARLAPVDDDILPVGIDRRPEEQNDVVENRLVAGIVGVREQLVGEERRVLRPGDLRCVEPAADVHYDFPVARDPMGFGVGQPIGMGEPHVRAPNLIEVGQVVGRRDEGDGEGAAESRFADVDELDAIGRRREAAKVGDRLFVIEQLVVGADGEAKRGVGVWQRCLLPRRGARDDSAKHQTAERNDDRPMANEGMHRRIVADECRKWEAPCQMASARDEDHQWRG